MTTRIQNRIGRQRGAATVEFALFAMLLVTLMLGASEFGRAMYQYNAIVKGVRGAVRHASNQIESAAVKTEAKNWVVYGGPTAVGSAVVPGLATTHVSVTYAILDATSNKITVTVSGLSFEPLASWLLPVFTFGPITAVMTQAR